MRILFAGSPAIALPALRMIAGEALEGRWDLAGVLTSPGTGKGRNGEAEPGSPLKPEPGSLLKPEPFAGREAEKIAAEYAALSKDPPAILRPETLRAEAREAVSALKPDLLVSFAYGRIFGPLFLGLFPLGGINVHPSLLPKYRGASPIQEAILRRDEKTGITVQRIALETDTGNILAQKEFPLTGRENAASLSERAAAEGAALLGEVLLNLARALEGRAGSAGKAAECTADGAFPLPERPQEGEASYCTRIEKEAALIDWSKSAADIDAVIRAYNPWPMARTSHGGRVLHILEAAPYSGTEKSSGEPAPAGVLPGRVLGMDKKSGILIQTGCGVLAVSSLQYQTKKALPWQAFLNGARDFTGSRLGGS